MSESRARSWPGGGRVSLLLFLAVVAALAAIAGREYGRRSSEHVLVALEIPDGWPVEETARGDGADRAAEVAPENAPPAGTTSGATASEGDELKAWFEEVAGESGVVFEHDVGEQRFWFPEIMAGGVAWIDADGDDRLDLYLVQAGDLGGSPSSTAPANRLFRNLGEGRFEDVTASSGAGDAGFGMGCAAADFDGDGDVDLFVANVGRDTLLANQGDGTFLDVTEQAGLGGTGWSTSAMFLDHDADGDLDLFVLRYVHWTPELDRPCFTVTRAREYCSPQRYRPARDVLYRNRGDGTFEDASEAAGLLSAPAGSGLGLVAADFDDNGHLDVFVANDGDPNHLWLGQGGGTFVERAVERGCAVNFMGEREAGMGVALLDLEHDGDLDLVLTHLDRQSNTCYRNQDGFFEDDTASMGLALPSFAFTGFGLIAADFDHDGRLDLHVANGRVTRGSGDGLSAYAERNQLFRGTAAGFEEVARGGMARTPAGVSRASGAADYDGDGDLDLAIVDLDGHVRLLRNVGAAPGRWIRFLVLEEDGAPAVGARVRVTDGQVTRWRPVTAGGGGFQASHDPRVHFGLPAEFQLGEVAVRWLDGTVESFGGLAPASDHVLRRGSGK